MPKSRLAGFALSTLIALFLIGASAVPKFIDFDKKEEMFAKMGWSIETMKYVGVVEVAVAVLLVIPQTAFIGAILTTAYLGGATAAHVRIDEPFFFPIIFGALVWIAYALRRPDVVWRAFKPAAADAARR